MGLISKAVKYGLAVKAFKMLKRGYQNYKNRKLMKNVAYRAQ